MTTQEIASQLVAFCKEGKFVEALDQLFDANASSIEPMGDKTDYHGLAEIKGKTEWWEANHEVHGFTVGEPAINGNQFVVRFDIDVTPKMTGERMKGGEYGVYDVANGKIVREAFFPIP